MSSSSPIPDVPAAASSSAVLQDAAHSSEALRSLLVGRAVRAAKQHARLEYAQRRQRDRRRDSDDEGASSSSVEDLSGSEGEGGDGGGAAEERDRRGSGRRGRHAERTTFVSPDQGAPKQNPLELMRLRAQAQEQQAVAAGGGAAPGQAAPVVLDPQAEVWPSELTHAAVIAQQQQEEEDDIDWEAEEGQEVEHTAAASSSAAAAAAAASAATAARPDLSLQASLSTQAATQPMDDVDDDGMDRAAWTAENEEVLFGNDEDDEEGLEQLMQDVTEHDEEAEAEAHLAAAAAASAPAAEPSVLSDPMLLNKVVLKASSAPVAPTVPLAASSGPLSISFAAVSNEQVSAELKERRYAERSAHALSREGREEAKLARQQLRGQRPEGAAAAAAAALPLSPATPSEWVSGESLTDRKSVFQAHACFVYTPAQALSKRAALLNAHPKLRTATHNMYAFVVRDVNTGVKSAQNDDDGERGAGGRLATLLARMGVENVLVLVTRWYGGVFLGQDRWKHINNLAKQIIERLIKQQEKWKRQSQGHRTGDEASPAAKAASSSAAAAAAAGAGSKRKSASSSSGPSNAVKKPRVGGNASDTGEESEDDADASASKGRGKKRGNSLVAPAARMTKANKQLLLNVQQVHVLSAMWLMQHHSSPDPLLGILTDELLTARIVSIALNKCAGLRSKGFITDPRKPAVWVGASASSKRGAGKGAGARSTNGQQGMQWKSSHREGGGASAAAAAAAGASLASPDEAVPVAPEGSIFALVQKLAYWFRGYFRCHGDRIAIPRSDKLHPLHEYDGKAHARMLNEIHCTCVRKRVIHAGVKGELTNPWHHYKRCILRQLEHTLRTREGGFQHLIYLFTMLLRSQGVLVRLCYAIPAFNYKKDMVYPPASRAGGEEETHVHGAMVESLSQMMGSPFGGGPSSSDSANLSKLLRDALGRGGGGASENPQDPKALLLLAKARLEKCPCKHPFKPVTYGTPVLTPQNRRRSSSGVQKQGSPPAATSSAASPSAAVSSPLPVTPRKKSDFLSTPSNTIELLSSDDDESAPVTVAEKAARGVMGQLAKDAQQAAAAATVHMQSDAEGSSSASSKPNPPTTGAGRKNLESAFTVAASPRPPATKPALSKSKSAPGPASASRKPVTPARASKARKVKYKEADNSDTSEEDEENAEDDVDAEASEAEAADDDTACRECGATDAGAHSTPILLCDGCDDAICIKCTDPPLKAVPRGAFFCAECVSAGKTKKGAAKGRKKKAATPKRKAKGASAAIVDDDNSDVEEVGPAGGDKKKRAAVPRKARKGAAAAAGVDLTDAPDSPPAAKKPRLTKSISAAAAQARKIAAEAEAAAAAADLDFDDGDSAPAPSPAAAARASAAAAAAAAKPAKKQYFEHGYPLLWCEFYNPEERRWVHLDVLRSLFDSPLVYEQDGGINLAYVVAVRPSQDGRAHLLADVTRRYTLRWTSLASNRLEESWFTRSLQSLSGPCAPADTEIEKSDRDELLALHAESSAALPTRLAEYKNHPLYVIEAHLLKFETIYPRGPEHAVGRFIEKKRAGKNDVDANDPAATNTVTHLVYPRSHLQVLHTAERWRREQRDVKEEELAYPVKIVRKLTQMSRAKREEKMALGLIPPEGETSQLYGIFQTVPWMPEAAVGGIVPKNARGHVDIWGEGHIPPGCVHLNYPRLKSTCKRLGVDYAEAMTGFDIAKGRSVPRFEGVVICAEFEADVMKAWRESEARAVERAEKRRRDKIEHNWRRMVRGSIARMRVLREVGADGQALMPTTGGAAAAANKRTAASIAATPYGDTVPRT